MRSSLIHGALALVLSAIFLAEPSVAAVLQEQTDEACRTGEADANQETSGALWFVAGCGLEVVGVVLAYVIKPTPAASRLVGKTPEYVAAYTDCYQSKALAIQEKWAWIGCGAVGVFWIIYYVAVIAAVSSSS
jgi:hypothetical protein